MFEGFTAHIRATTSKTGSTILAPSRFSTLNQQSVAEPVKGIDVFSMWHNPIPSTSSSETTSSTTLPILGTSTLTLTTVQVHKTQNDYGNIEGQVIEHNGSKEERGMSISLLFNFAYASE